MRRLIGVVLLVLLAGSLAACNAPGPVVTPSPTAIPATSDPGTTGGGSDSGSPPATLPPPETLTPAGPLTGEVTFATSDGVTLHGTLQGEGTLGVALAPMVVGQQAGWQNFAAVLAAQGYRVLTYDMRGMGTSEGAQDAAHAPTDLAAAVAFLRAEGAQRIVILGAGIGGSAAIRVAGQDRGISGIAAISAPRSFQGLEISDADLAALTAPSLWIGTRNDLTHNIEDMQGAASSADKELWFYEGSSLQGTYIFEGSDSADLQRRLLEFVARLMAS